MKLDLSGRTALVTGGTRGIGRQIAADLARAGARVMITGTAPAISQRPHRSRNDEPEYLRVDFSKPRSTKAFLAALSRRPPVDILINNAGINRISPIDETRPEDWDDVVAVNLTAPYLLIRYLSKGMKKRKYGRIVNIGSVFGVISKPQRALYSATKHGIHGLTIASALDLAPYGVLVNTVSPGFVETDLTRSILGKKERAHLAAQVPLGRFADVKEISPVVLFLCSSLNTFITGQNIVVDGGFVNV